MIDIFQKIHDDLKILKNKHIEMLKRLKKSLYENRTDKIKLLHYEKRISNQNILSSQRKKIVLMTTVTITMDMEEMMQLQIFKIQTIIRRVILMILLINETDQ